MGKLTPTADENALFLATGTLTGGAASGEWFSVQGAFNLWLLDTHAGTVEIDCSPDGGLTVVPVPRDTSGAAASFTGPSKVVLEEIEAGVLYRVRGVGLGATNVTWRVSK